MGALCSGGPAADDVVEVRAQVIAEVTAVFEEKIAALEKENAALKAKLPPVFEEFEEKIAALEKENAALKAKLPPSFTMGCAASKGVDPTQPDLGSIQRPETKVKAGAKDTTVAASLAALQFEQLTPMLVMPFRVFREQHRIVKSTKEWRDKARKNGDLIIYEDGSSKIVIFISHTWWDRDFKDDTNDLDDVYDHGAPDHQRGAKKDLKWRIVCDGVQRLVERDGLNEDDVHLWIDWQSIYQDDKEEKLKGVKSLIQYATLCEYMLVPTEEKTLTGAAATYPEDIPGYGKRGWW